ncbi:3-phenylpropionate/cinnamic acid dioxygenase small subunit [Bradyrhizobium elkanii]
MSAASPSRADRFRPSRRSENRAMSDEEIAMTTTVQDQDKQQHAGNAAIERSAAYYRLKADVEDFYYREADLLDDRRFRDWLELLTDDISYFMPIRRNVKFGQQAARENTKRGEGISWFDEDKWTLTKRVEQILTGVHYAEEPLSRITHMVSNVQIKRARPGRRRSARARRHQPLPRLPEPRRVRDLHLRRPPQRHAAPDRQWLEDRAARDIA